MSGKNVAVIKRFKNGKTHIFIKMDNGKISSKCAKDVYVCFKVPNCNNFIQIPIKAEVVK